MLRKIKLLMSLLLVVIFVSTMMAKIDPGEQAVDFCGLSDSGSDICLYDFTGDIIVLNFFAGW